MCYVDLCKAATYVPPTDDSVLRHIAADIEDDLQEKVWDFTRSNALATDAASTSTHGYVINRLVLVTDYLLARLRLDPDNTLQQLVPQCLDDNSPLDYKLALVKACLDIAREDNRLAWNPSLPTMYKTICAYLRKLSLQTMTMEFVEDACNASPWFTPLMVSKKMGMDKRKNVTAQSRLELLEDLLRLFRTDPLLALLGNDTDPAEDNAAIMTSMANLFQHSDQGIRQLAGECLAKLHLAENIIHWGSEQRIMINFWRISSKVVFILAKQILDIKNDEDGLHSILDLLMRLFSTRNDFLRENQVR